jgi:hypothetical protein
MSTIVLQLIVTPTPYPTPTPAALFLAIGYAGTDNSGAAFTGTLNGTETPPWSATLTGADGPSEVTATFQAADTAGNPLGAPFTLTESGTGGQPQTFPLPTGGSITVTG